MIKYIDVVIEMYGDFININVAVILDNFTPPVYVCTYIYTALQNMNIACMYVPIYRCVAACICGLPHNLKSEMFLKQIT